MESIIKGVTENYGERVKRLALFDCLYKLENKKTKDNSGETIDFFGLGLLTLLFFFENMLMRNKKTGIAELTKFLHSINHDKIDLDYKDFEKISRTIIEAFRPPSGKRNFKGFYNWETRQESVVEYSILKASKSDIKNNTQYYTLDEDGLELIFATKEYFSEFQLSINQLLLRKQLEKGEFVGALRQIDEMRIDVENLEDRMAKIKHEVQRNILSEKTYERYKTLIEDINIRLLRENKEFEELVSFVNETREKISYELKNEKDIKTYQYITKIQIELDGVHKLHRKLLEKSIDLKSTTLQSAHESLYYVGIDSFNFKKEVVSRIFSSPLPLKSSRNLIKPLLYLERINEWSPTTVFAPQRIENKTSEVSTSEFLEIKKKEKYKEDIKIQQNNFKNMMEIILKAMDGENEISLKEIIGYINDNYIEILNEKLFYHFLIILHQKSPVNLKSDREENDMLLEKVIEILKKDYNQLNVVETNEVISVNERFSIKNMIISLEENGHVL